MLHRSQLLTTDGWRLGLRRLNPAAAGGRPLLLVPGFGMNAWIFGYHPSGPGLQEYLAARGYDAWAVDLRGQGDGRRGPGPVRLAGRALVDLPHVIDHIRDVTGHAQIDAVGCSLGGALLYTLMAHRPHTPLRRLVAMASPLRWVKRHPVVALFGAAGPIVGRVPVRGSRIAARVGLPVVGRVAPWALSLYMTAEKTDLRAAGELVRTVEDPHRHLNRQMAAWIRARDLVVEGLNVREALSRVSTPLMVVTGSADGIAPPAVCTAALHAVGGETHHLHVGGPGDPWSHTDLFIGRGAQEQVFEPIARWLGERAAA